MDKKAVENSVANEILSQAFTEAAKREFENIDPVSPESVLSEKNLKEERRAYRRKLRSEGSRRGAVLKKVASFAAIIAITLTVLLSVPSVRAGILNMIVKVFDGYIEIGRDDDANTSIPIFSDQYLLSYVPEGFVVDANASPNPRAINLVSGEKSISIRSYRKGTFSLYLDTENSVIEEVTINGATGYYSWSESDDNVVLVWNDEHMDFVITGNIPREEIIKIAKNLKISEK